MSIWDDLSTDARRDAIRDLARQGMTEAQIMAVLGAPNGSIRTVAKRVGIALKSQRERKAQEATPYGGSGVDKNLWTMDDDRRRDAVASRAAKGAREALRAFR